MSVLGMVVWLTSLDYLTKVKIDNYLSDSSYYPCFYMTLTAEQPVICHIIQCITAPGATCYLNSVIQTMFMTPDFRRAVFKWKYDKDKDGEESLCIPLQLQRLFGFLQLSKSKAVDTVDLTR